MAGTDIPRKTGGRVYCGYSSRPAANDSSTVEASSMAPGRSRMTASMSPTLVLNGEDPVLAGTIPGMSFVAERWITHRVRPMIAADARPEEREAAGKLGA